MDISHQLQASIPFFITELYDSYLFLVPLSTPYTEHNNALNFKVIYINKLFKFQAYLHQNMQQQTIHAAALNNFC